MSENPPLPATYKDRYIGLVGFGILELVLGGCSSLLLPLSLAGLVMKRGLPAASVDPGPAGALIHVVLVYGGLAAFFLTMGVGSLRARRWARTLMLVGSWIWLASGLLGLGFWLLMLPAMREALTSSTPAPEPRVLLVILACTTGFLVVLYILLPLALVLFYRSPNVRATCEARDPNVPWTDRCAPPVLAASLLGAIGALSLVGMVLGYRVMPFFVLLTGLPALLVALLLAAAYAWASVELYRERQHGWWMAVGTGVLLTLSGTVLFFTLDVAALYSAMGYPERMLPALARLGAPMRWVYLIAPPLWLAFVVSVRKYLPPAEPAA